MQLPRSHLERVDWRRYGEWVQRFFFVCFTIARVARLRFCLFLFFFGSNRCGSFMKCSCCEKEISLARDYVRYEKGEENILVVSSARVVFRLENYSFLRVRLSRRVTNTDTDCVTSIRVIGRSTSMSGWFSTLQVLLIAQYLKLLSHGTLTVTPQLFGHHWRTPTKHRFTLVDSGLSYFSSNNGSSRQYRLISV